MEDKGELLGCVVRGIVLDGLPSISRTKYYLEDNSVVFYDQGGNQHLADCRELVIELFARIDYLSEVIAGLVEG